MTFFPQTGCVRADGDYTIHIVMANRKRCIIAVGIIRKRHILRRIDYASVSTAAVT